MYLGITLEYQVLGLPWSSPPSGRVSSPTSSMVQGAWPQPAVPVTGQVDFT